MCTSSDAECKVWGTLFNRLSNHSVVVLHVSCHLCQFELGLNLFAFVNILRSSIVMIPLGLRKSFALAPYTLQFVYLYICKIVFCSRKLTVSPNLILMNIHVYYVNG